MLRSQFIGTTSNQHPIGNRLGLCAVLIACLTGSQAYALQTVTLNFDSVSLSDPTDEHVYTPAERLAIKETLEAIYMSDPLDPGGGPLGVKFEIFDPLSPPPPFTTSFINFNNGFMGGAAEKIDFRNTDDTDDADVNALGLLKSYDGAPKEGGGTWTLPELTSSDALIMASANLAAHELGHALGLRHHDSFGPISSGIAVAGSKYDPVYTGPVFLTNSSFHVMGLASTVSLNANTLLTPSWFSERSAMKLAFNTTGVVVPETAAMHGSPIEAQDIPFEPIIVPNTQAGPPDPYYPDPVDLTPLTEFIGSAGAIIDATLDDPFEVDYYVFDATAGTRVSIEAISKVIADTDPGRIPDPVDMKVELLDFTTLLPLPYPNAAGSSVNDNSFESTDAFLIDVDIPYSGTFLIEVSGSGFPGVDKTGMYELYLYGFGPFPPPFLAGDLNEDGFVGLLDLDIVLDNWNATVTPGDLLSGDPNGDGFVGLADLDIVLNNWNAGTPPSSSNIPEPATLMLLGLGAAVAIRRSR